MQRTHVMPFGAQLIPGSGVRFRLWAPSAERVDLCLGDTTYAMAPMPEGWYELLLPAAKAGDRYRFQIDGNLKVPDPASRFNPDDVHGESEVVDPAAFDWADAGWQGRRWEHAVIYELHLGCFTAEGTLAAAEQKLPYLADLGVTAVELMPLADFPGTRNWGYDGVLQFAPDSRYGRPQDLKRFIQTAHGLGLMVLLDAVYNHFGPDGNYLAAYAAPFFTERHTTPWGAAIDFSQRPVRDFYIHNALYWIEEYHFDGLRLDAVHAIHDDSLPHIVEEIAAALHSRASQHQVHLVLENDNNQARFLVRNGLGLPTHATAQWNDDMHHVMHVLLTGEIDGYYSDYASHPTEHLGRCLAEGFAYQGDPSLFRDGERRGERSAHLPPAAFVDFLQNHDQIGNRAFGERIGQLTSPTSLEAMHAVLLLSPHIPLLFMGEEFAAGQPFLYFCDYAAHAPDLAAAVTAGRRREFSRFARFADPALRERIPDPNAEATYRASQLDWTRLADPGHARCLLHVQRLLHLRHDRLMPHLAGTVSEGYRLLGAHALTAAWRLGDGSRLTLFANLGAQPVSGVSLPLSAPLYRSADLGDGDLRNGLLPAWSVGWWMT